MRLRKLNPVLYSTIDQLARAIGKSRQYVEDRVAAVETVRSIRKVSRRSDISVKQAPTAQERKEGALPIKHATFLHKAEESPAVQRLPEEKRAEKLTDLAETIAEMVQPEARKLVEHFVMARGRPVEELKQEVETVRAGMLAAA